jgi:hypothetical protein
MAIANIFQKLGTVQTAAIAGVLSLSSLLPFNATAQEPRVTPVSNNAATADLQERLGNANQRIENVIKAYEEMAKEAGERAKGPPLVQARIYSLETPEDKAPRIGVLLLIGPKNPGDAVAAAVNIQKFYKDKGIEIQIFPDKSPREVSAVSYSVNGKASKAHILKQTDSDAVPPGAELAYEEYKRVHGITAEMLKSPSIGGSAIATTSPTLNHQ